MVEKFTNSNYVKGSTYYELSKSELVQSYKEIIIVSRKDDKKFGGQDARDMLGLPLSDTKVKPGDFGDWRIFIQSIRYDFGLWKLTPLVGNHYPVEPV